MDRILKKKKKIQRLRPGIFGYLDLKEMKRPQNQERRISNLKGKPGNIVQWKLSWKECSGLSFIF